MTKSQQNSVARVDVNLTDVKTGISPRAKTDKLHAKMLADTASRFPPILVNRRNMTIIDGAHRFLAARMRGERQISVVFFDGDDRSAYLESVRQNVGHGKPLTLAERRTAVCRVLQLCPELSDRAIAQTCGVSPKTVGQLRRRSTEENAQLDGVQLEGSNVVVRVGLDGRARPVTPTKLRRDVAETLERKPDASLRSVATEVGVSVGTVRDVRGRVETDRGLTLSPGHLVDAQTKRGRVTRQAGEWPEDLAPHSNSESTVFADRLQLRRIRPDTLPMHISAMPICRIEAVINDARAQSALWNVFADALAARLRSRSRR